MELQRRRGGQIFVLEAYSWDSHELEVLRQRWPGAYIQWEGLGVPVPNQQGQLVSSAPVFALWRPRDLPAIVTRPVLNDEDEDEETETAVGAVTARAVDEEEEDDDLTPPDWPASATPNNAPDTAPRRTQPQPTATYQAAKPNTQAQRPSQGIAQRANPRQSNSTPHRRNTYPQARNQVAPARPAPYHPPAPAQPAEPPAPRPAAHTPQPAQQSVVARPAPSRPVERAPEREETLAPPDWPDTMAKAPQQPEPEAISVAVAEPAAPEPQSAPEPDAKPRLSIRSRPKTTRHKNITRVDHAPKDAYGYLVRLSWNKQRRNKFFSDRTYGDRLGALSAAIAWRDQTEKDLGKPRTERQVTGAPTSNTGMVGITRTTKGGHQIFQVTWYEDGRQRRRTFNIDRLGEARALQAAVAVRNQAEARRLR